ncbi:hypothetical protein [Nitrosomonas cryotolerans]|uniref:hypothetical protein n=1 Tax=Nitrosomonas cryotolerans TaxID=44575 RepID=UPI00048E58CA|nr:hypothetical protein [Nitrosomonas cryotolerans]
MHCHSLSLGVDGIDPINTIIKGCLNGDKADQPAFANGISAFDKYVERRAGMDVLAHVLYNHGSVIDC